jgi:hypothetical protein
MASVNVKRAGTEKNATNLATASKSTPQTTMVVFRKSSKQLHTEYRFDHGDFASVMARVCAVLMMEAFNILVKIVSYRALRVTTVHAKQTALVCAIQDGWARPATFEILLSVSHAITITVLA